MARRSRHRSGMRKPAIIALVLIVLISGWFWQQQRARHAAVGEAPPTAAVSSDSGSSRHEAPLALPPVESTRVEPAVAAPSAAAAASVPADRWPAYLPAEARQTLRLIAQGGPFPHRQDGSVFGNREGHLPPRPRGYYHEYTVDTPGLDHRGARRIVTGGQPPGEYYYSDDHYESFRRFDVPSSQATP